SAYIDRNLALTTYTEIPSYLGSRFDQSSYTSLDTWNEESFLFLKNTPIIGISITYNGSVYPTTSYSYNADQGYIYNAYLAEPTVTYTAGYTTSTAPADLKLVALQGVKSLYENNSAASSGSGNVQSKRIKDFSVTYGNEQSGYLGTGGKIYLKSISTILNRYKRIVILLNLS